MEKSRTDEICTCVALLITIVSLFVTFMAHVDIRREIAAFTEPYTVNTVTFTAKNTSNQDVPQEISTESEQPSDENSDIGNNMATTAKSSEIRTTNINSNNSVVGVQSSTTKAPKITTTKAPKVTTTKAEKVTQLDTVLVLNTNSKKIHSSKCSYAANIKEENKLVISSDEMQNYINDGYTLCSRCQGCKTVEG